jgi:putative transposase
MSQAISPSSGKRYGLARVSRIWKIPRSTVYFRRQQSQRPADWSPRRRGPQGPCSDEDLAKKVRLVIENSPFHGEGHRKVWAKLRFSGLRTSKHRVLRIMREQGILAHQRVGSRDKIPHDGTIITDQPDEMWGTDMSAAVTLREGSACVFVAVDHCTGECIGIHASKYGNRFEALEPLRQGVREHFGSYEAKAAAGLLVRHDHGSNFMSDDYQKELKFLGIDSSPAFVRQPEGNGCAERFIRTLKENLLWVKAFDTIEELRLALLEFKRFYNEQWIMERHGYLTPTMVRALHSSGQEIAA